MNVHLSTGAISYTVYTRRRRIKTEEKAKVVSSVWGKEFIKFERKG